MIDDQTVHHVRNVYDALDKSDAFRSDLDVGDVLEVLDDLKNSQEGAINAHSDRMEQEIGMTYLAVAAAGAVCRAQNDSESPKLLSEDWLEPDCQIDPNRLLDGLLVNITNHILASVEVLRRGLAGSGSVLMRSIYEITSLALVLAHFREDMVSYSKAVTEDEQFELFRNDLKISKIGKKMRKLESEIGVPDHLSYEFSAHRKEAYHMYSKSVHGQLPVALTGKWAPGLDGNFESSLFGAPSIPSKNSLYYMNLQVLYFINILLVTVSQKHQFDGGGDKSWELADTLIKTHTALFKVVNERRQSS